MSPESLELTAALIVAGKHREEWKDVLERLQEGETFLTPEPLQRRVST